MIWVEGRAPLADFFGAMGCRHLTHLGWDALKDSIPMAFATDAVTRLIHALWAHAEAARPGTAYG